MPRVYGIFLMYLNQITLVVIDFLNETDCNFVFIYDFNISAPAKISAFTLTPVTPPAIG